MSAKSTVIIMAGGLGKRMYSDLPKVLHKIGDVPMLVRVVREATALDPERILIVVGKYKDVIEETLAKYVSLDNIEFILQEEAQGTGHAILCCREALLSISNSGTKVLILSGDTPLVKSSTMRDMLMTTKNVNVAVTVLDNPHGYGRIVEKTGVFEKITEEKDCTNEEKAIRKINCGMYAFNADVLCTYLPHLKNDNAQKEYYLTDMIQIIKENEETVVNTYEIPQNRQFELKGVNTREQLAELEQYVTPSSFEKHGKSDNWML
jgi:UDP-N-acetylglucosamine diphosphorylase/glucosamine-1-phosphate N-acetyltransferase